MKNDKAKPPMRVVLLDEHGNQWPGVYEVAAQGQAGIRLKGRMRVLPWDEKGKTWRPVEDPQ